MAGKRKNFVVTVEEKLSALQQLDARESAKKNPYSNGSRPEHIM